MLYLRIGNICVTFEHEARVFQQTIGICIENSCGYLLDDFRLIYMYDTSIFYSTLTP